MANNNQDKDGAQQLRPVYIVTGATGAMGSVISRQLAEQGKPLVLACRRAERGKALAEELKSATGNADITCMHLDMGSFGGVREFVGSLKALNRPVAALINNAAVLTRTRETSADGYERTVQVNFLSAALLALMVEPLIVQDGHIVLSTSHMRNFVTLPFEFPAVSAISRFMPLAVYAQSKLALTLFSIYLSTTMRTKRIMVNMADPGLVNTGMLTMNRLFNRMAEHMATLIHNPENGAISTMRALESKDTGFIFKGVENQVKASTTLKSREVFIKLCNDTMRLMKKEMAK